MINSIIHGDCLEEIYKFPPKSVDLILTDPPYNIGTESKLTWTQGEIISNKDRWGNYFIDEFEEHDYMKFMNNLCDAYNYVLSDEGSIITFFDRGKPYYLTPFYKKFNFRNMIIFVKKNPSPHVRKNNYRSGFEMCGWFSREKYYINFISQRKMKNVFSGLGGNLLGSSLLNVNKQTDHPTEKYEWMIYPLIIRHSKEDDLILDPMCGSGTTCAVSKKLNRRFIGIDIDIKYVEMSRERINNLSESLTNYF
jgi:DNA modification methylase